LTAFDRISRDNPNLLLPYADIFANHAISNTPHILIQKYTASIGIKIENASPGTYENDILVKLRNVGKSTFKSRKLNTYSTKIDSYLHIQKTFNNEDKYLHGWDIDQYWFAPLGRLFGISEKQVDDLATDIILSDWKIKTDGRYISEPRDIFKKRS